MIDATMGAYRPPRGLVILETKDRGVIGYSIKDSWREKKSEMPVCFVNSVGALVLSFATNLALR